MADVSYRNRTNLGDVLRGHREATPWSQVELGERVSISASLIARFESGEREPAMIVLCALRDTFGLSWAEFFVGLGPLR